jgi:hypothetical protein
VTPSKDDAIASLLPMLRMVRNKRGTRFKQKGKARKGNREKLTR